MRRTEHLVLLGLDETATAAEIRAAYLRLAKQLHPDVNAAPEALDAFRAITEAYRALGQAPAPAEKLPSTVHKSRPPVPAVRPHRQRWAGATFFSVSFVGALIAAGAAFRTAERPAPVVGDRASHRAAPVVGDKASHRAAPAAPAVTPPADTPSILMGRSARNGAETKPPAPAAPRVALVDPAPQVRTPASASPGPPGAEASVTVRPNVGGQTKLRPLSPFRPLPAVRSASLPAAGPARPREKVRAARSGPARTQRKPTVAAPAQSVANPPTVESLAGSSLNVLRSLLQ